MLDIGTKKIPLIDAHCHIWQKIHGFRFKDVPMVPIGNGRVQVGEKTIQFMAPQFLDSSSPLSVLETEFENTGVDKACLLQTPCYGNQIDYVAAAIEKWPDRFMTTGCANPCYGKERFLQEAEIAVKQKNCKALKFEMPDTPFVADDPENAYIFEFILDHGLYCMVDLGWGKGAFDYPIEAYEKVVKRYKDLTFIFPHLGVSHLWDPDEYKNFEHLKRTLGLMDLNPNVWFDMAGLPMLTGEFEEYPYPLANTALKFVKDTVGMDHIMFGTDYPGSTPFCTYKQSIDEIAIHCSSFLTESDKEKLFYQNAEQLWFK